MKNRKKREKRRSQKLVGFGIFHVLYCIATYLVCQLAQITGLVTTASKCHTVNSTRLSSGTMGLTHHPTLNCVFSGWEEEGCCTTSRTSGWWGQWRIWGVWRLWRSWYGGRCTTIAHVCMLCARVHISRLWRTCSVVKQWRLCNTEGLPQGTSCMYVYILWYNF